MSRGFSVRVAAMQRPGDHSATYAYNQANGGTNHYGNNIYSNLSGPGGPGGPDRNLCIRDLKVTDPREDKARIDLEKDRLLKQCYGWILEDASFQRWRDMDDARLLWIKGDPGKGKTMMTMGLIDELSPRDGFSNANLETPANISVTPQPCLLAYFFCQSTRQNLNNVASVLRGLIYILVVKRENLVRHVQKPYDTEGGQLFERVSALVEILSDILNNASLPMMYLSVDALDECVSGLPELLNIIPDDRLSKPSRTKWLVTSQNLPDIERYLHQGPIDIKIGLELSASHVSKAVTSFIDVKVQALVSMKNYDRETQANVQQLLLDRAEGTFLWVWLVCKRMESVPRYRTMFMLRELPPKLDPLYDRMKEQILEHDDEETVEYCKHILQLIVLAFRPLRLEELVVIASLATK
jgi:hypothetical protein